jgi:Fic-DOC domain mobile mystery protein B
MSDGIHNFNDSASTPLNPQETAGLIPPLSTQEELNEAEALNIAQAINWYANRKKKISTSEILTEKWVKLLHKKMYCDVWSWAGKFRHSEKNIGLANWTRIPIELKQALDNAREQHSHLEDWNLSHQMIAAQLSHKAVWIHPFPNGNGRWSRELANAYLRANNQPIFTWGAKSYVDPEDRRNAYVKALKNADNSADLRALLSFAID